jgi:hypothetical protein
MLDHLSLLCQRSSLNYDLYKINEFYSSEGIAFIMYVASLNEAFTKSFFSAKILFIWLSLRICHFYKLAANRSLRNCTETLVSCFCEHVYLFNINLHKDISMTILTQKNQSYLYQTDAPYVAQRVVASQWLYPNQIPQKKVGSLFEKCLTYVLEG